MKQSKKRCDYGYGNRFFGLTNEDWNEGFSRIVLSLYFLYICFHCICHTHLRVIILTCQSIEWESSWNSLLKRESHVSMTEAWRQNNWQKRKVASHLKTFILLVDSFLQQVLCWRPHGRLLWPISNIFSCLLCWVSSTQSCHYTASRPLSPSWVPLMTIESIQKVKTHRSSNHV